VTRLVASLINTSMLKKLFNKLFSKKEEPSGNYIVATLNDKVMPMDRGDIYEDPLDEFLKLKYYGEVTGSGTGSEENGEIAFCDIEICLNKDEVNNEMVKAIIVKLEELGAPKGSNLLIEKTGEKIPFGINEGLAIYLDGANLSDEVYKNSDTEAFANEIIKLANIKSDVIRYWQGNTKTGLYFYGESFNEIRNSIADFVKTSPDCENCRIVQVA
jgi:hypothetical protein